jgi:hypothetical protein
MQTKVVCVTAEDEEREKYVKEDTNKHRKEANRHTKTTEKPSAQRACNAEQVLMAG